VHKGSVVWKHNTHEMNVNELNEIMINVGLCSSVAYSEIYVSFCALINCVRWYELSVLMDKILQYLSLLQLIVQCKCYKNVTEQ
jgi:hypothetical protein